MIRLMLAVGIAALLLGSPGRTQEAAISKRAEQKGATISTPSPPTAPMAPDASGALYVAEAIAVTPETRDAFVDCLRSDAHRHWRSLQQAGLLADVSVFETSTVREATEGAPGWTIFVLSHLRPRASASAFFGFGGSRQKFSTPASCTARASVEVRRVEVLQPTPNSSYPKATLADDAEAVAANVQFVVEYIAVRDTPVSLDEYRNKMRANMGAAMGLMIPQKVFFEFLALETVSVEFSQPGMPAWNNIHVRGFYPGKAAPPETDAALRHVNPGGGGSAGFFGSLKAIRTKAREDVTCALFDLAVR